MKKMIIFVVALILCFNVSGCGENTVVKEPDITQIRSICNLSTLECYFHNVAKSKKEAGSFLEKDREFWIEYTGTAKIGIDMSKVSMKIDGNTVSITLPEAELQNIDILEKDLNKNSYIQSADGWVVKNKITAEDQTSAIKSAQAEMEKTVTNNSSLFITAQDRAKKLIENYINKMGEISGITYNIKWIYEDVDEPMPESNKK